MHVTSPPSDNLDARPRSLSIDLVKPRPRVSFTSDETTTEETSPMSIQRRPISIYIHEQRPTDFLDNGFVKPVPGVNSTNDQATMGIERLLSNQTEKYVRERDLYTSTETSGRSR